jgi:hypothetical protein
MLRKKKKTETETGKKEKRKREKEGTGERRGNGRKKKEEWVHLIFSFSHFVHLFLLPVCSSFIKGGKVAVLNRRKTKSCFSIIKGGFFILYKHACLGY